MKYAFSTLHIEKNNSRLCDNGTRIGGVRKPSEKSEFFLFSSYMQVVYNLFYDNDYRP